MPPPPDRQRFAATMIEKLIDALRASTVAISEEELDVIAHATNLDEAVHIASVMTGLAPYTLAAMAAGDNRAARQLDAMHPIPRESPMVRGAAGEQFVGTIQNLDGSTETASQADIDQGIADDTLIHTGYDEAGNPTYSVKAPALELKEQLPPLEPFAGGLPRDDPNTPRNEDYIARGRTHLRGHRPRGGAPVGWDPNSGGDVRARYLEHDAARLYANKDPVYTAEFKQRLVDAGIMTKEQAGPMGWFRLEDEKVVYDLLHEANINGVTIDFLIDTYKADPDKGPERAKSWRQLNPFVSPVFKSPDYATMSQAVRAAMAQEIGRDPHDWELALMADQLRADFNSQHASTVQAARQEWEATARAHDTESAQSSGSVQDVDPMARLAEYMHTTYAPERQRIEAGEESQMNVSLLMRSITGLQDMIASA